MAEALIGAMDHAAHLAGPDQYDTISQFTRTVIFENFSSIS